MTDETDKDGKWHPWFAVLPVTVDAFTMDEVRYGRMSYRVWMQTVLRRWDNSVDPDDEDMQPQAVWRYRLVPKDGKIP